MFQISPNANPNYLAKIVKITGLRKHSNADRLMCTTIDGNNVITSTEVKEGDVMVYFPLECTINDHYLSWSNSYRDKTLNHDPEQAGFFDGAGRVKAIRLRGEKSEGYIVPLSDLYNWIIGDPEDVGFPEDIIGTEFDTIRGIEMCKKYIPPTQGSLSTNKDKKLVKRISRLVEGQFRLHEDTEQLRKNIARISPDDVISITYKLHGTSFAVGKVLTKRKLRLIERIARKLGVRVQEHDYGTVYASRRVIKNEYETQNCEHYYSYDMWGDIKDKLQDAILDGITLYGEAVGFTREGGYIQAGYDYGVSHPGAFSLYIYRITFTNTAGKVIDLTWGGVKDYCNKFGLNYTPELFYGKAKDHAHMFDENHHWHQNFLNNLENLYTEKDCWMCTNKVPAEGVVVRKDKTFDFEAYKLKSFAFLEQESKNLDKGVVDMETAQSENGEVSV